MALTYFLVFSNIMSNALNPQHLDALYCLKRKCLCLTWCFRCFECLFFDTYVIVCCYFVIPCQYSHLFIIPHLSSSLVSSRFVFVVNKLRSFLNKNTTPISILTRERLNLGTFDKSTSHLGIFFKTLA